jgi:DNA-binding transcriptional ArsR family regulator
MEAGTAVRLVRTRDAVAALRGQGLSATRIAAALGIAKSTVSYHLRRLGEPADTRCNRRYDCEAVQRYYDDGHRVSQCLEYFGMARASFVAAVRRQAIRTRPRRKPIEELLRPGVTRSHLRLRLVADGLEEARCERCGLKEWRGGPAPLQLHHINGDGQDNRIVISGAAVAKRAGDGRERRRHVIDEAQRRLSLRARERSSAP